MDAPRRTWPEAEASMLLRLIRVTTAHRDRERLFDEITGALVGLFPVDALAVVLDGPGADQISPFILRPSVPMPPRRRTESALAKLFETGEAIYVPDRASVADRPGTLAVMEQLGAQSYLALPLIAHRRVIGALVLHGREPRAYDTIDRDLAAECAQIIATALDGCLAYEELERSSLRLTAANQALRGELGTARGVDRLVGAAGLHEVIRLIERVGPTDATALILGETGTGKELVARAIHEVSLRAAQPMITLNCAAIPSGLVEAELFGHEHGAFTGAVRRRKGRFELADGGTLFLDEIGDLPPEAQAKLLRVLETGELERLGGSETMRVDVRVIAATHRDLLALSSSGVFRPDLYYRLAVFPIAMPPLRDRRGDIPALVQRFVTDASTRLGRRAPSVDAAALALLAEYDWPGNVRELQNVIERAVILSFGHRLEIELILGEPTSGVPGSAGAEPATEARTRITAALDAARGVIEGRDGAAARLGLAPSTLRSRMKRLGVP